MLEEMPERPGMSMSFSERQASFLAGVVIAACVLILVFVISMFGLLVFGIISGSAVALITSLFCLIACLVLMGLLSLIFRVSGVQKLQGGAGTATDTKAKEGLNERTQTTERQNDRLGTLSTSAKARLTNALAQGHETYAKVKEELNSRYSHVQRPEPERQSENTSRLDTYYKGKEELRARYNRAKDGEY